MWGYSIPHGVEPSGIPVTLVCGPPASGKSAYVANHASPIDKVIDLDVIRQTVGGTSWDQDPGVIKRAFVYRSRILRTLKDRRNGRAWLIVTAPSSAERDAWRQALGNVTIHTMDTTEAECIRRIEAAPERQKYAALHVDLVRKWFRQSPQTPQKAR